MKARTKVLLTSVASIAMCASIAVGGTYALFTDEAKVNVAVTSGTVDVEATIVESTLATYSRGIAQTPAGSFANDANGVVGATLNSDGSLTLMNITPGDKVEFFINVANYSNVDIAYRVTTSAVDTEGTKLAELLKYSAEASAWTFVEGNGTITDVKVSVELPEEVTYADLSEDGTNTPAQYGATVTFTVEAIQGNGGVFGEVNVFNEDQVASALAGKNAEGKEVIVTLPGDVEDRLVVGEGVNATLNLDEKTVNDTLENRGTLNVNGGTIEINDRGFENYGEATVENVTMNAGSPTMYANTAYGEDAETTYTNATINSNGGGVAAVNGAKVVFNSGVVNITATTTNPRYNFYAEGAGSEIVINGGEFDFTAKNLKRAYIYASDGTTVIVNGGTFGTPSTRSGYSAGILTGGTGKVIVAGGTFGFDPTTWVPAGYVVTKEGATWTVKANVENITEALANGENVTLYGDVLGVNNTSNGYGSTMVKQAGGVFDGNGYTLAADKASGTWDSTVTTAGGTIKNVNITKGFRGIFVKAATETVYLDNVVIKGTTYTISCDSSNGHGLVATNSKFFGWTSYAKTIGNVSFTNCEFGYGNGYQYLRPYAVTTFEGCEFNNGMTLDFRADITLTNCTYAGQPLTMELFAELVNAGKVGTNGKTITVNGVVYQA